MNESTEIETDFSSVMQELSARAANGKEETRREAQFAAGMSTLVSAIHSLGQRVESLEESVLRKFETIHFEKLEGQIEAIRKSETVNQKLFDSLHQELISYRDNFVRDALQKPIVRDLITLFDDLSGIVARLETPAPEEEDEPSRLRENIGNTLHFLLEILHRLEVTEIETSATVDRQRHRVISVERTESADEDGQIVRRLKRGFTWHDKVLRPEEVVIKRLA